MALTRTRNKMPDYGHEALTERKLMDAYRERPDYQQNDYIGSLCVTRAKREETKEQRLSQTLDELEGGKLYMNMAWTKSHTLSIEVASLNRTSKA